LQETTNNLQTKLLYLKLKTSFKGVRIINQRRVETYSWAKRNGDNYHFVLLIKNGGDSISNLQKFDIKALL